MGTRSTISCMNADGTATSIYCHWDGYISHHGPILLNHYDTEEKVRALLELGFLSVLGEKIGKKHVFDAAPEGVCTAYGRDRGEADCAAYTGPVERIDSQEYNYLFKNGKWYVSQTLKNWKLLTVKTVAEVLSQ